MIYLISIFTFFIIISFIIINILIDIKNIISDLKIKLLLNIKFPENGDFDD